MQIDNLINPSVILVGGVFFGTLLAILSSRLITTIVSRTKDGLAFRRLKKYCQDGEDIIQGFGLVCNGSLVMDEKGPLLFSRPDLAEDYSKKRGFGKAIGMRGHGLVQVVYQKWFLKEQKIELGEVRYGSEEYGKDRARIRNVAEHLS